jgi:hypothetical protein
MKPTLRFLAVIVSCVVGLSACQCSVSPPPAAAAPKTRCADVNATVRKDVRSSWPNSNITMRVCTDGWAWVVGESGLNGNIVTNYYRVQGNRWVKQYSWAKLFKYCTPNPSITGSTKFKKALQQAAPTCKSGEYVA